MVKTAKPPTASVIPIPAFGPVERPEDERVDAEAVAVTVTVSFTCGEAESPSEVDELEATEGPGSEAPKI